MDNWWTFGGHPMAPPQTHYNHNSFLSSKKAQIVHSFWTKVNKYELIHQFHYNNIIPWDSLKLSTGLHFDYSKTTFGLHHVYNNSYPTVFSTNLSHNRLTHEKKKQPRIISSIAYHNNIRLYFIWKCISSPNLVH